MVQPSGNTEDEPADNATDNTRRQFMAGSAGVVGGLAIGGALSGSTLAQEDDGDEGSDDEDGTSSESDGAADEFADDVEVLNYALTLEYLEASFYRQGLENISEDELCNCAVLKDEDSPLADRAYDELMTIKEHEETHVEKLRTVIGELGGEPVEEPTFDFGLAVEYPMAFLGTAQQLEDVGVSAYAGAAPAIENPDLVPPALGIHSVEARHASFLRTLNNETSYPNVVDEPRTKSEVLEIAGQFIVPPTAEEDGTENGTENGTETGTENGTETGTGTETGNGTGTGTENGTETGTGTETGSGTDTGTEGS